MRYPHFPDATLKEMNETELKVDPEKKDRYYDSHVLSQKLSREIKRIILELESYIASNSNIIEEIYNKRSTLSDYEFRICRLKEERENTSFFELRKRKDKSVKIKGLEDRREELYSLLEEDYNIQDMYQLEHFVEKVICFILTSFT